MNFGKIIRKNQFFFQERIRAADFVKIQRKDWNFAKVKRRMLNLWVFLCCISYFMGSFAAAGNVVMIAKNVTFSFDDIEANFAPSVRESGICGTVSIAEPLDACSLLTNEIVSSKNGTRYPFVLIIRGGCSFEDKIRRAQAAGFEAAIVYDNGTSDLVAMAGNPVGININAVFISKVSGETLARYAGTADLQLWIVPSYENPSWSMIALSFISLIGVSAVLATCFFVRRHRFRSERLLAPRVREFHGISSRLVKAMPSLIFTAVLEDNCTSQTCAICLEDYSVGEKLRVLPCRHKFHAACVDTWLTSWRTFCPVCKQDAKTKTTKPPASESTPLLPASLSPSLASSPESSSPMQIGPSVSLIYNLQSHQPPQSDTPPLQPDGACAVTSNPTTYTSLSTLSSIYVLPYVPAAGNVSSTYFGSSSHAS
ncbi:receptor homology region, transmembrane domain- and RING domain-containing protein 2-like [Salvia splendens]|uniref:receptor homology region, transmembrane domain- and RING domain-containing protein 2-like n=1 Tax=Salvia splendens TaxID=180675 RepID=UPI001C273DF1|nr:receptor homology region, transmembrane domain- and RING domain-containing protein 2-like [Salvia splendens]